MNSEAISHYTNEINNIKKNSNIKHSYQDIILNDNNLYSYYDNKNNDNNNNHGSSKYFGNHVYDDEKQNFLCDNR
jgi:hypothetical protein